MGLYTDLQQAQSEEDVKQIYIKHLKLNALVNKFKGQLTLGLVDIKTDTIWFEAKHKKTNPIDMFTQLIYYVKTAKEKGDFIPPFLAVVDSQQAAILETSRTETILADKSIKWGKSASKISQDALEQVANQIQTHYVVYNLQDSENEFKQAIQIAFSQGKMVRNAITPNNLRIVFDNWVDTIGNTIKTPKGENLAPEDYALFFYADIMNDGGVNTYNLAAQKISHNNNPAFMLNGLLYSLDNIDDYNKFWSFYNRPPAQEHRNYLLERRDALIPLEAKLFKGAFYTPLHVVEQAYNYLNTTLGKNWQKDYIVWDMCCGTGNLQVKHSNYRNIFMSTLDNEDVDIMQSSKVCVGASIFQYDYLNDDIDANGNINYSLTNKIPKPLQELLQHGTINGVKKKLLILINPPYAEAGNGISVQESKANVATTKVAEYLMGKSSGKDYGKATNELFTQFVARILQETTKTKTTLAMFSKLKYVNAPNFAKFKEHFKATYLNGFVVHSQAFEALKGNFPVGFLMWQLSKPQALGTITTHVLTKNAINIGTKNFYNLPNNTYLNKWLNRPKANTQFAVPLKNAVSVATGKTVYDSWSDNAIAYFVCDSNDLQHTGSTTFLLSSRFSGSHLGGMYITPQNLLQASIVFAVRRVIKPTWLNDRDQFLQPNINLTASNPNIYNIKTPEGAFVTNCLAYMLFSGSNLTASSNNIQYNNQTYSITNHFIPFTESQIGANARFESDFLTNFINQHKLKFTTQAQQVIDCGKDLWQLYFKTNFSQSVKNMYHLHSASVGWYQVRKSLEEESKNNAELQLHFNKLQSAFKLAFNNLSQAIEQKVYDYEFLKQ